ncbi:MAG: geranylgeranyl reductase family protein, partial [Candidatus Bathycorpusculaceae bacterium]
MKFDVIIVGGGVAGCLAAKTAAEEGLRVCLIERKRREEIGEKICGDALGEHHLKGLGLEKPSGGELERRIEGIKIYSPNLETVFTISDKDFVGHVLNRRLFGQWLLRKAIDSGTALLDSTQCLEPTIEKNFVTGVSAKNLKTHETLALKGRVIVDASGFSAVIRRKLPAAMGVDNKVANEDVEACYREIRELKQEAQDTNYCELYLNQKVSPGGYAWIFPKGGAKVNAGLGIRMCGKFPNPKDQFYKHILTRPLFEGSLLLSGGAWYDPTRRPFDNMVGNGVIVVGDAACLVNPIHGGGIGPAMLSGHLAGKTIVEALEEGCATRESMWSYNRLYMEAYGKKQAAHDAFRMLLQSCSDEDLNYGMKCKLITEEDVLKAGLGEEFHLKITEAAKRVFKGLRRVHFLNRLRQTVEIMKQIKAHYEKYPEAPENFEKWRLETEALFN